MTATLKELDEVLAKPTWEEAITSAYYLVLHHAPEIRAALELKARMTWQPIETIPNTNEVVLAYVPNRLPVLTRGDDWHSGFADWLIRFTHWMPLPAPPAQENEKEPTNDN